MQICTIGQIGTSKPVIILIKLKNTECVYENINIPSVTENIGKNSFYHFSNKVRKNSNNYCSFL